MSQDYVIVPLTPQQQSRAAAPQDDYDIVPLVKKADAPGTWERLNTTLLPQIGQAGRAAANFISQPRLDENVPEFLRVPIAMQRGLLAGSLEGAANLVEGFTSPVGLATTAAGLPAARYVAPALVPAVSAAQRLVGGGAGAVFAAEGIKKIATAPTWSEKAAAIPQVAGGLMGVTAGMAPTVARVQANRAAKIPKKIDAELSHAFPASHAAPYTADDMATAAPFALAQHRIRPATTTLDAIEAFNGGVRVVEQRVDDIIAQFPHVRAQANANAAVRASMGNDVREDALEKGLRAIRGLRDLHQPATLTRLEAVRRRLNAENQAHLDRNQYDRATARETDPAFRAREIAAESVREAIYGTLERQGAPGIADFRRAEGSVIKVRNAAERQHYSGEKIVSGAAPSLKAEIGAAVTQAGMTAAGTGAGILVGMPIPGAITGSVLGQQLGRKIRGHRVVRDELVARAFSRAAQDTRIPIMPPVPSHPPVAGLLGPGARPMGSGPDPSGPIPSEPFISRVIPRIEAGSAPPSANQAPPRTGGPNERGGFGGINTMGQIMGENQVPFNSGTMPLGGMPSRGNAPVQTMTDRPPVLRGVVVDELGNEVGVPPRGTGEYIDAEVVSPTRALPRGVYAMPPSEASVPAPSIVVEAPVSRPTPTPPVPAKPVAAKTVVQATTPKKVAVDTPTAAASEVTDEINRVIDVSGTTKAIEIKRRVLAALMKEMEPAKKAFLDWDTSGIDSKGRRVNVPDPYTQTITITIPDNGTFRIKRTPDAIAGVIKRVTRASSTAFEGLGSVTSTRRR